MTLTDRKLIAWGWLGVRIQPLTKPLARTFGLDSDQGVLIADVIDNGPSDQAGMQSGDIVTEINERRVDTTHELLNAVADAPVGSDVALTVIRNGDRRTFTVSVGYFPWDRWGQHPRERPKRVADIGLTILPLTPMRAAVLELAPAVGVLVHEVDRGSPAEAAHLRRGDVILRIGSQPVSDPDAFWSILSRHGLRTGARLLVQRGRFKRFLIVGLTQE